MDFRVAVQTNEIAKELVLLVVYLIQFYRIFGLKSYETHLYTNAVRCQIIH